MRINLPNQITLARLAVAIVFFVLLAQFDIKDTPRRVWLLDVCFVLFILAAVTDWLDGHLARRRNEVTAIGRVLDPFVDKVLVCGTFVFLAGPSFHDPETGQVTRIVPWMAVIIIGREMLVTGLRGFSESRGVSFGASVYGKTKMVLQSVTAPVLLFFVAHLDHSPIGESLAWAKDVFVWLTVAVTALSMLPYLFHSKEIFSSPSDP